MITPNDIETKVFSYAVRGYNKNEVDEFLDQIMIDYQALLSQNERMKARIRQLQNKKAEALGADMATPGTIKEAQIVMNDITKSAEKRAEVIIQNAEKDAANIVKGAKDSTTQADEEAVQLRKKIEKFKKRYKDMLQEEIERVDDNSEDLLADLKDDFYPEAIFDEPGRTAPITHATGLGVPDDTKAAPGYADGQASEPEVEEYLPDEEPAGEEKEEEDREAEAKDPLIERAEKANVDLDDLPGFRSSASTDMDKTMVFKTAADDTMDLSGKAQEEPAAKPMTPQEKAKELKEKAGKIASGILGITNEKDGGDEEE